MKTDYYSVWTDNVCLAKHMTIESALLFIKALFEKHWAESDIAYVIHKEGEEHEISAEAEWQKGYDCGWQDGLKNAQYNNPNTVIENAPTIIEAETCNETCNKSQEIRENKNFEKIRKIYDNYCNLL